MSETPDRVPTPCPSCSPDLETVHEVLTEGGGTYTVRCSECSHVHKVQPDSEREVTIDVVVSQGGESFTANVTAPEDESIEVGDEFILETEEVLSTVRVTSVELDGHKRVEEAPADEIETVWTREVDNVAVNVTVHPQDGSKDDSRSITVQVPGDYEFEVGAVESFGDDEFEIDAFVVRGDAEGYRRDRFEEPGDTGFAKDIKRVYAYDEQSSAWSAW
ncbi:Zn-finger protein-like protein [Natrinema pellirubrum DSM 15624]|uniref:Zn-finger protein n=1 Tax=Natrinema pellirubrum (strain DSM 15624 / CIP 106293 / JCM 10476 / NCIMB 786 / 157) TaxID=797303 RepID=L0JS06_NATP1|nr:HVO_0476 family zinc finger protein [Natrinema pellirubrum]AGB33402.1 putative Zn-finger protein [Natrinema pellirubrum DSM 15624]ELY71230.1 Zn-finger protein-like protein [Natrinema pellirubrum DSM 15624]